jgi:hypothetical protein
MDNDKNAYQQLVALLAGMISERLKGKKTEPESKPAHKKIA